MKEKELKEELTTAMHSEFCLNEAERLELAAIAVFSDIRKGIDFQKSLSENNITEDQFDKYKP